MQLYSATILPGVYVTNMINHSISSVLVDLLANHNVSLSPTIRSPLCLDDVCQTETSANLTPRPFRFWRGLRNLLGVVDGAAWRQFSRLFSTPWCLFHFIMQMNQEPDDMLIPYVPIKTSRARLRWREGATEDDEWVRI